MNNCRIQIYLDEKMKEILETFLKNNNLMFKNATALFRYMLSNIELLTTKNNNIVTKKDSIIKKLKKENEILKIKNLELQSELLEKNNSSIISFLEKIDCKLDVLEVINSTSLTSFGNIKLVNSKDSEVYRSAIMKVNKKNDTPISQENNTIEDKKPSVKNSFFTNI